MPEAGRDDAPGAGIARTRSRAEPIMVLNSVWPTSTSVGTADPSRPVSSLNPMFTAISRVKPSRVSGRVSSAYSAKYSSGIPCERMSPRTR